MKTLIGIIATLSLLHFDSNAQSLGSTKIHFLNAMSGMTAELKTAADPRNPIRIKSRTWVIIRPVGDSLTFLINNKPYSLHFEPNKQYYFSIQTSYFSLPTIIEKSEREFILSATLEFAKGPEEYSLQKVTN